MQRKVLGALAMGVALLVAAAFVWRGVFVDRQHRYTSAHGNSIVRYTLSSSLLGRELHPIGVVPPGGGRRPLLVLLHGRRDGGRLDTLRRWLLPAPSGPEAMLTDALLVGLAGLGPRAPVVVLLDGGAHSYYHDRRDGPWATALLREAIPGAARRFGTLPGRIAVGGISMGGYGALHLATLTRGRFCAVGGHSPALFPSAGETAPGAFDDAADFARNDVWAAARAGALDDVRVWLDVGDADGFRAWTERFGRLLRTRKADVEIHTWPGGHDRDYWNTHTADYLGFYSSALADCRP